MFTSLGLASYPESCLVNHRFPIKVHNLPSLAACKRLAREPLLMSPAWSFERSFAPHHASVFSLAFSTLALQVQHNKRVYSNKDLHLASNFFQPKQNNLDLAIQRKTETALML